MRTRSGLAGTDLDRLAVQAAHLLQTHGADATRGHNFRKITHRKMVLGFNLDPATVPPF